VKINTVRTLKDLKPVLLSPPKNLEIEVYWVFSEMTKGKWANMTVITPEMVGDEYPKTFGHYHGSNINEISHVISGEGIYQIQKKHYDSEGKWIPDEVDAVYFVKGQPGDEIVTTSEYAHSWTNLGKIPLVLFDDWRSGHTEHDYEHIRNLKGMAYYVTINDGNLDLIPNPNYKNLPPPKIVTADNYRELVVLS
jgi:glucose-6-phosphate isomerase